MANSTPSGAVKHRESTEPESGQTVKMFFFFFFFSLFLFRRASSTLREPLTLVYARNSSMLY